MSPNRSDLAEFSALTFDCYGTLIDWETGIWDALQPLLMANPGCEVERSAALAAFGEAESAEQLAQPETLYPGILAAVHRSIAARFGLGTDAALDAAFGDSVQHWPAFSDTAGALRRLKKRYRLVILSNVDRAGIAASNRKLGVAFDAICTAQDIGSYKPDPRNFAHMIEHLAGLGLGAGDILHTAQSLRHDHVPARAAGLANAWIDRQGQSAGGDWGATAPVPDMPEFDFIFPTLEAMADAAGL